MRRMAVAGLDSVDDYARKLIGDPIEINALYRDLLINVTSFFRDPGVFEALKITILPRLMQERRPDAPLRIWVPGWATGQEAYSIAMTVWEYFDDQPVRTPPAANFCERLE
jgi:two-component system CheB/CheR fusion protein